MTRSFWIFEAFLAVAGVLAGLIFHCIFKFYVNPQMQDINWTWMGFITFTMVIAGFPAWLAAKKTSWLRLTVFTNVFNFVLLALVPLWYIAFGSDGMEKTLAWYFSAAWALSGVLPAIFACAGPRWAGASLRAAETRLLFFQTGLKAISCFRAARTFGADSGVSRTLT